MPAVKNSTIVERINDKNSIAAELAALEASLEAMAQRHKELSKLSDALSITTEIFNGVALHEFDGHITPVDFSNPRAALVFEHAGKPGTFRVQAATRYNGDTLLPNDFTSREAAVLAAKDWVTSA
jgi:hypothetical protein